MLAGRVRKAHARLAPAFEREGVFAFRLYDWDIPEVRAVVDWYEGQLVVAEYHRRQTESAGDWLRVVGLAAAAALDVPPAFVHLKRRRTRPKTGARYPSPDRPSGEGAGRGPGPLAVRERGLKFRVNLRDYLDTGLFLDQRDNRRLVRQMAAGRSVLNLFCYTGGFSVAALAGKASHVTSVDLSRVYIEWSKTNLRENELALERHEPVQEEAFQFLDHAAKHRRRWDLVIVDPPSFSTTGGPDNRGFDVRRDHRALVDKALGVLAPGGQILFSTHHQRFEPSFGGLSVEPLDSVPRDFRNRGQHQAFLLRG